MPSGGDGAADDARGDGACAVVCRPRAAGCSIPTAGGAAAPGLEIPGPALPAPGVRRRTGHDAYPVAVAAALAATAAALGLKSSARTWSGVTDTGAASSLRAAMWSAGRLTDSTPSSRPSAKQ
jgi:hypothetical protein